MNDARAPVALITGAATPQGAAIARRLHGAGYAVLLHYDQAEEAVLSLAMRLNTERRQSAHSLQASLLEREQIERLAREALAHWGRLDLLVNLACADRQVSLKDASEQDWQTLLGRNLKAPWLLAQSLAPALAASAGSIVNVSGVDKPGAPAGTLYALSLRALEALTPLLAADLAPAVRVLGLSAAPPPDAPGLEPEAVAAALCQLLEGEAGRGLSGELYHLPLTVAAQTAPPNPPRERPGQ